MTQQEDAVPNVMKGRTVQLVSKSPRGCWCAPAPKQPRRAACCISVSGTPPDRPDLAIYSQEEQLSLGIPPTWDSPDILTNQWSPFRLYPETQVTVRNLSATVSAVNASVTLLTSAFGIGLAPTTLATQVIALGPGQNTTLLYPLPQAILNAHDQRIATFVQIQHPYDGRLINNAGSQLLADAYTSKVGRKFTATFPVMNPRSAGQQLTLAALTNALGAAVTPTVRAFAPLEQIVAHLTIEVPAAIHGTSAAPVRQDVTIVGYEQTGRLLGGLTYVVWIDD